MSNKQWQRTNKETFLAHLELFDNVRHMDKDEGDSLIYYTVRETGQQWIGKVMYGEEVTYHIALV